MSEVFKRYLDYLKAERNASVYTLRNYRTDLQGTHKRGPGKGFFQFLQMRGVKDFGDVDKQLLRDYLAWLMEQGVEKSSLARRLSAIRSFYRFLLNEGILLHSPIPISAAGRKGERSTLSPKLKKKLPVFLTIPEINALLSAPDLAKPEGVRDKALLEVLYASGLRVSEIWQLDLDNLNRDTREIRVTGKGDKERVVLIGKPALEALNTYLTTARPALLNKNTIQALWLNKNGRRLSMRGIQKQLKHYSQSMGLEKNVHPHVLRHTFATHMLDADADLRVVQELLGHADLSSTQIYTHVTKSRARQVYLNTHPMARSEDNENAEQ